MRRIYIYQDVMGITNEWHNDGGLVIITDSGDPVKVFRDAFPDLDPDFARADPPHSYDLHENVEDQVYVFPNTGCC